MKTHTTIRQHGMRAFTALAMSLTCCLAAQGQTQLATWSFNYEYVVSADGTATPSATVIDSNSGTELAGVRLRPDYQALANGDYSVTAVRPARDDSNPMQTATAVYLEYKSIKADGAALHITNPLPTAESGTTYQWGDTGMTYPDGREVSYQQPYNYFQLEFPATGYKNIVLKVKAAGHKASLLHYVVATSTDGQAWTIAGSEYQAGTSYNKWNTENIALGSSFDGVEKAFVRIFPAADWKTNSSTPFKDNQFDIDALELTGDEDIHIDPSQFIPSEIKINGVPNTALLKSLTEGDGHHATLTGNTFTTQPEVAVVMTTGKAAEVARPEVNGNTCTYAIAATAGSSEWKGTVTIENVFVYKAGETDTTHAFVPGSGTSGNRQWTDGSVRTDFTGDWAFKLADGDYEIAVPSNWKIKQVAFLQSSDNYSSDGFVSKASSGDADVHVPSGVKFEKGVEKDILFTIDNHRSGTPFDFSIRNAGQATVKKIEIAYEEVPAGECPRMESSSYTSTESANHCVVTAVFSHAVASAEAEVNGHRVDVDGTGTPMLNFKLWDLDYGKTSKLMIKAGKLTDKYGNTNSEDIVIPVEVGARPVAVRNRIDYVVTGTAELRKAVEAAGEREPDGNATVIMMMNGDYDLASEPLKIASSKVSIVGESRDGVLIHGVRDGITNPIVNLSGSSEVYLADVTIRNDKNWAMDDKRGVAVALTGGDRTMCRNVALQSNQDTYVSGESGYFTNCDIHGTVDFICGGGDQFFDSCNLILEDRQGDVIVAPNHSAAIRYGYVFSNCTIKAAEGAAAVTDGSYNLGRPWQNCPRAAFLNTRMLVLPSDAGWAGMSKGLETHFYEYASVDADGKEINLDKRSVEACQSSNGNYIPVLTTAEAERLNLRNVTCGNGSWDVAADVQALPAPAAVINGNGLTWTGVDGARCYVIYRNGKYFTDTTAETLDISGCSGDSFVVLAMSGRGVTGKPSNEVKYDSTGSVSRVEAARTGRSARRYALDGTRREQLRQGMIYISKGQKIIYHK